MNCMIKIPHCLDKDLGTVQEALLAVGIRVHPSKRPSGYPEINMLNSLPNNVHIIGGQRNL